MVKLKSEQRQGQENQHSIVVDQQQLDVQVARWDHLCRNSQQQLILTELTLVSYMCSTQQKQHRKCR